MLQNFQIKNESIKDTYLEMKEKEPERFERRIDLSWSIWMFGQEPLERSFERLKSKGLEYVELKGSYYTADIKPDYERIIRLLEEYELKVSGVCGLYSENNDLASPDPYIRQNAIDYIKRQVEFTAAVGGKYLIVVPSAVGRTRKIDDYEFWRSVETLRKCGEHFASYNVKAAIEPIRSAEVSLIHTVEEAIEYIEAVNHDGVKHINGDVYHMLNEEEHVGEAILKAGNRLINLHLADSNRDIPGKGMLDFDVILMASYLVGMNEEGRFLTFEPLGPYADPYVLLQGTPDPKILDSMVEESVRYVQEREEYVRSM